MDHSSICDYWLDQYWNECTCGLKERMSQREYFEKVCNSPRQSSSGEHMNGKSRSQAKD